MAFTIINETEYRTDDLRRLVTFAASVAYPWSVPTQRKRWRIAEKNLRITFVYRPKKWITTSGRAYYGGEIKINISRPSESGKTPMKYDVAAVIGHELGHSVSHLRHGEMRGIAKWYGYSGFESVKTSLYNRAEVLPLRLKGEDVKPKVVDLDIERSKKIENCDEKIAEWERKMKAAETKVKTWKRKRRGFLSAISRAANKKS